MALKFIEGFDDGLMSQHGWANTSLTTGRFGGKAWYSPQIGHQTLTLATPLSGTLIVGFALFRNYNAADDVFAMGSAHLYTTPGGALQIYNGGTLLATSTVSPWQAAGAWRYVEVKQVLSTGATTVRVDGTVILTGTVTPVASIGALYWQSTNNFSNAATLLDDVYIADATGASNNDFLGEVRVQTLLPNADGTYGQFTPSTGTTHSTLVQEATPNTTDYVSTNTTGQKDTYQFPDLSAATSTVYGVELGNYSHKDALGAAGISNMVRVSATDYAVPAQTLVSGWNANRDILELNPITGVAWTPADVNSAEFGIQSA